MTRSNVLSLSEPTGTMTYAECLVFLDRTRRQLDRFDTALPHSESETIDPEDADAIRCMCDELEADIRQSLSGG
jgi:hypothetical protein